MPKSNEWRKQDQDLSNGDAEHGPPMEVFGSETACPDYRCDGTGSERLLYLRLFAFGNVGATEVEARGR